MMDKELFLVSLFLCESIKSGFRNSSSFSLWRVRLFIDVILFITFFLLSVFILTWIKKEDIQNRKQSEKLFNSDLTMCSNSIFESIHTDDIETYNIHKKNYLIL